MPRVGPDPAHQENQCAWKAAQRLQSKHDRIGRNQERASQLMEEFKLLQDLPKPSPRPSPNSTYPSNSTK